MARFFLGSSGGSNVPFWPRSLFDHSAQELMQAGVNHALGEMPDPASHLETSPPGPGHFNSVELSEVQTGHLGQSMGLAGPG